MKQLNRVEQDLITYLVKSSQEKTKSFMSAFLRKYYKNNVYETGDFICAKGDIPVALVAHMDIVFKDYSLVNKEVYYDKEKNVMWSPEGAGFDDRAGLYAITRIIRDGFKPHVILLKDEEVGGVGASAFIEYQNPLKDVRFLIELDRNGADDCVFYDCDNPDFVTYIENFGFIEDWGSFSDISVICPDWKIAGVNLSIGYKNEHTTSETLHVSHMLNTIRKVEKILSEEDWPSFKYIPRLYNYSYDISGNYWYRDYSKTYRDIWSYDTSDEQEDEICCCCGKTVNSAELIYATVGHETRPFCIECISNLKSCINCHDLFLDDSVDNSQTMCRICEDEIKLAEKESPKE